MRLKFWLQNLCLSPDDLGGGGSPAPAPSPQAAVAPQVDQGSQTTPPDPGASGQQPAGTPASGQATPPAAPSSATMEWLKQAGHGDLAARYQTEQQLVQDLLGERQRLAMQMQQYQGQLQQVMPHWAKYQDWLKTQQPQQQPAQKPWYAEFYNPPEYDPSWDSMIKLDLQGNPLPGTPIDLLAKRQAYEAYQKTQMQKFVQNPMQYIEQPVRHLAKQIAQEAIQAQLTQYQDQNFAKEYTQRSPWLFQQDASGQVMYNQVQTPQGMQFAPVLSQAGQRFREYAAYLEANGVHDVRMQQQLAERLTLADMQGGKGQAPGNTIATGGAQNQAAGGAPPQLGVPATNGTNGAKSPEQIKADFLRTQASTNGGGFAGRQHPGPLPGETPHPTQRKSFMEIAREEAARNGTPFGA